MIKVWMIILVTTSPGVLKGTVRDTFNIGSVYRTEEECMNSIKENPSDYMYKYFCLPTYIKDNQ